MTRSLHTPGRLWSVLRRDLKRGWTASREYYKTLPMITEWAWPFWNETPQTTPVHVLVGQHDWMLSLWMLASWFTSTEHAWPVVVHDDGSLPPEAHAAFLKLFPTARIISRPEADDALAPLMQQFPFCADFRRADSRALKVFDIPHLATDERFFLFANDLLFFRHPREVFDWAGSGKDECWFNEDLQESSLITAAEARSELGVKIWPRVNSGLCLLTKAAIDLDLCDRALAQTSIPSGDARRIEQTLLMLCAARHGQGGLLAKTYEVSLAKFSDPNAISRRYVGPARDRIYAEGLPRLKSVLFPDLAT